MLKDMISGISLLQMLGELPWSVSGDERAVAVSQIQPSPGSLEHCPVQTEAFLCYQPQLGRVCFSTAMKRGKVNGRFLAPFFTEKK